MTREITKPLAGGPPVPVATSADLIHDVRQMIDKARQQVATTTNAVLTTLHWRIGKRIGAEVLGGERAAYGEEIVSTVSRQLDGILLQIQKINPLGQLIEISHILVIDGRIPPLNDWLYTTIFVIGIFFFGYFLFHKMQDKITEKL